jgi:hypothetical protein
MLLNLFSSNGTIDIRASALNNSSVSLQVIESIAAHTISILFNKLTGPTVRLSLVPLFGYIDHGIYIVKRKLMLPYRYLNDKDQWWPPNLAVNIMKLVLDSLQVSYKTMQHIIRYSIFVCIAASV